MFSWKPMKDAPKNEILWGIVNGSIILMYWGFVEEDIQDWIGYMDDDQCCPDYYCLFNELPCPYTNEELKGMRINSLRLYKDWAARMMA